MPLALASGGERVSQRWRSPTRSRNGGGRLVGFLFAIGREAPCGPSGRFRGRMRARRVGVRGRVHVGICPSAQMPGIACGEADRLRKGTCSAVV